MINLTNTPILGRALMALSLPFSQSRKAPVVLARLTPNPSVNRTACKLRLQVRSGLRPPPAGYVERWASVSMKHKLAVILLTCYAVSSMAREDVAPEKITSFGNEYASACLPGEIAKLRSAVMKLAGNHNPTEACELTEVLLCKTGKPAEKFALLHMPKRIVTSESSTGDEDPQNPPKSYIPRSTNLMRKGFAWAADATPHTPRAISIGFTSNEVCSAGFTLRFISGRWLLVEVVSGCD